MIKYLKKIGIAALAVFGMVSAASVKAAADTDLESALATTTAYIVDNKGIILGMLVSIFGVTIVVTIINGLLSRGRRQIGAAVGGGRRRK